MKITCIGTGFVGVVTTAVLAKLGNKVIGLDIDEDKIAKLKEGVVPFFEPGLSELLINTQKSGNLTFTTDYHLAVPDSDVVMIMVGTPSAPDGSADLRFVESVAESIAPHLKENAVVVIKSTVPPGTNKHIRDLIGSKTTKVFHLASVPEFLKEGTAVEDTLHPDRVVIGVEDEFSKEVLTKLHEPLTSNILVMNPESAQMTKYAANNYLATRITFINQIADLCEYNGADIEEVIKGIGADRRIGPGYWYPGLGYGGSCFPKDVKEIAAYAKKVGEPDSLFIKINALNEARVSRKLEQFKKETGTFSNKTVAVLGLSFKKNTNDTRVAPSLAVIPWLISQGATVRATDPQAVDEAKALLPKEVVYAKDAYAAATNSDIIILLVEWDDYTNLDLSRLAKLMKANPVFIDTRNQYEPKTVINAGFKYIGVGR
ncbi:MAG: UDP-glucose 6-dehydrogenase [bacterium]|nr:UDP-glucose/GDP-mannose dehydrogenase family protein [Candidatus Microgenomates bacterium CPR3]MCQ3944779.1 UDP-glucose 6-dehydrogenase [bacterium]RIK51850.1 MAG: UDP-glucose 6-dehydrogenase [Candidatus Microgenomates bacterium]